MGPIQRHAAINTSWRSTGKFDYVSDVHIWSRQPSVNGKFYIFKMAIELQPVQSSKKKSKRDRNSSDHRKRKDRATDVSSKGDLTVDEGQGTERQRKKRKREREGAAVDGALAFSLAWWSADSDAVICTYNCRYERTQR